MSIIEPQQTDGERLIANIIRELPTGALLTWGQVEFLCKKPEPVYLFIINIAGGNPVLQFKRANNLLVTPDAIHYRLNNERVAQFKYFNRTFLPTFFIFDNYMHCIGLEMRMKPTGFLVQYKKFE